MKNIIIAWQNNNSKEVLSKIKKDKRNVDILLQYTNKIKGENTTMIQGWILQEVNLVKDNGYGIYELPNQ